ncbi:chemotaxis protein, partial [Pseudomonas syringae pv. tagetis]
GQMEALSSVVSHLSDKVTSQSADIARLRAQLGGIN